MSEIWENSENLDVIGAPKAEFLSEIIVLLIYSWSGAQGGDLKIICDFVNSSAGLLVNSSRGTFRLVKISPAAASSAHQLQQQMATILSEKFI